jgi:hypothetical protein
MVKDHKPITVIFPDLSECEDGFQPYRNGEVIWYTDGSKIRTDTVAGIHSHGMKRKLSFILEQYITIFLEEVYATDAHILEDGNYNNTNIYILSDRQAALKQSDSFQSTPKVVWDCL